MDFLLSGYCFTLPGYLLIFNILTSYTTIRTIHLLIPALYHCIIVSLYRTEFGLGYAWQPAVTVIAAGDVVRFQWTSPLFLNTNLFRVLQTFSAEADYDGTGFNSGTPSPTG